MRLHRYVNRTILVSISFALGMTGVMADDETPPRGDGSEFEEEKALRVALQLQEAFAFVAQSVSPSVVCVTSYVHQPSSEPPRSEETGNPLQAKEDLYPGFEPLHVGSGVIFAQKTHVVTLRRFVIQDSGDPADIVDIETHDGRHFLSRVLGVEPTLDIAVLEFVALSERYPPKLIPGIAGDSDSVRVGHWVVALGDPSGPLKGFAPGFLAGRPERRCYQAEMTVTYMQAALRVHPEAYGGPLVNIHGEIVGLMAPHTPSDPSGDGFELALPVNIVLPIYNGIRVNKGFRSPWLGFSVLETSELHERLQDSAYRALTRPRFGVYIDSVYDSSPAAKAGIRMGDFLLSFNGRRLFSVYQFQEQLHLTGIGRTATLEVFRDGKTLTEEVMVVERPEGAALQ